MFPLEVLTFLGSSGVAGVMKLLSKKVEMDKLAQARDVEERNSLAAAMADARNYKPQGGVWTRRSIVWSMLLTVFVAPIFLAYSGVPVVYAYSEAKSGFLWGLFGGKLSEMKFVEMVGMVILPVHVHIAATVGGFYFGSATVK